MHSFREFKMTDTMRKALKCVLFIAGLAGILFVLSLVFYPKNNEKEDGIIDVMGGLFLLLGFWIALYIIAYFI